MHQSMLCKLNYVLHRFFKVQVTALESPAAAAAAAAAGMLIHRKMQQYRTAAYEKSHPAANALRWHKVQ